MLKISLLFYVLAVGAILLGFTGPFENTLEIGRLLLGVSIGLVVINFATSLASGKTPDVL